MTRWHSGDEDGQQAAIYVRVSTDKQTIENQLRELRQIAKRRGWEVVQEYRDAGISGAKSRDARPGLDQMLKDAQRRRFDVVMAWAIDRLGRSLIDLLGTIQALETCGIDLYLDQQSIDTTTRHQVDLVECPVISGNISGLTQRNTNSAIGSRPPVCGPRSSVVR